MTRGITMYANPQERRGCDRCVPACRAVALGEGRYAGLLSLSR